MFIPVVYMILLWLGSVLAPSNGACLVYADDGQGHEFKVLSAGNDGLDNERQMIASITSKSEITQNGASYYFMTIDGIRNQDQSYWGNGFTATYMQDQNGRIYDITGIVNDGDGDCEILISARQGQGQWLFGPAGGTGEEGGTGGG